MDFLMNIYNLVKKIVTTFEYNSIYEFGIIDLILGKIFG